MGGIISDDVILKNGSDRKSGLITEISSVRTVVLTLYDLEQATVSVQPKCSHPQTTHQISFYLIRKTWTLMNLSWGLQCCWEATSNTVFMAVLQKPSCEHPV